MIVSDKHKYVYIAHESTASRSISEFLINNYEFEIIDGKHIPNFEFNENLSEERQNNIKEYNFFTIVRHPFTRLISIWDRCHSYDEDNLANPIHYGFNFSNFIEHIKTFKNGKQTHLEIYSIIKPFLKINTINGYVPRSQVCENNRSYKIDLILKYEDLPNCLTQLPFITNVNLPIIGKGTQDRTNLDTPENRTKVYDLYKEDYDTFGYEV